MYFEVSAISCAKNCFSLILFLSECGLTNPRKGLSTTAVVTMAAKVPKDFYSRNIDNIYEIVGVCNITVQRLQ
jgi:hypothetical protein